MKNPSLVLRMIISIITTLFSNLKKWLLCNPFGFMLEIVKFCFTINSLSYMDEA